MRSGDVRVKTVKKRLAGGEIKEYRYEVAAPSRGQRHDPDSVNGLIRAYKAGPQYRKFKEKTLLHKTIYLRDLEVIGHLKVKLVLRRTVMGLRDAISSERGDGAANGFLKVAVALFSWARENGWIEHSPVERAKRLEGGHLAAWTDEEADRAIAELPAHLARVVILARHTGQRRADLAALRWSAYDGSDIRLVQEKQKQGSEPIELVIPVSPELRDHLAAWKRGQVTSLHILTTKEGRPWSPVYMTMAMRAGLDELGFRPALNVHGLRKLAASSLANAGCSVHQIAAITGHATLAMVELYTKSANQQRLAKQAMRRMVSQRKPEMEETSRKPIEIVK